MNLLAVKFKNAAYYQVKPGDPVKYRNTLYGKAVYFNRNKNHVKFESDFSAPGFLNYDQIDRVKIFPVNKKKLLILAGLGSIFVVGVPFIFAILHMAPWKVEIHLKNAGEKDKAVLIRPFLGVMEMNTLVKFIEPDLTVKYFPDLKARKQKLPKTFNKGDNS